MFDDIVRIDYVEHRFRHFFNGPATDVFTVFENKFGIGIIRHPFSEGFCVQNVVLDDVDIYMDLGCFVLTFQTGRYIGIGPYDAVYEIRTPLYHSLIDQFLERFRFTNYS